MVLVRDVCRKVGLISSLLMFHFPYRIEFWNTADDDDRKETDVEKARQSYVQYKRKIGK